MTTGNVLLAQGATAPTVVVVNKHRDVGDIFSLFFLGLVVMLFASGIGGKLYDVIGVGGALLITSPLWGWLMVNALKRLVNRTTVTASPGSIAIRVGPIAGGSRTIPYDTLSALHVKQFENRSSTRGGSVLITKTFSVWARLKSGEEVLIAEPLDSEAQAKAIEKELNAACKRS